MLLEAVRDQEEASAPALWLYGERVLPEHGYVCERELWFPRLGGLPCDRSYVETGRIPSFIKETMARKGLTLCPQKDDSRHSRPGGRARSDAGRACRPQAGPTEPPTHTAPGLYTRTIRPI